MKEPAKATIRREWWQIIESVSRIGDREILSRALIGRLFGWGTCLPDRLKPIFSVIEREIVFSEKQRKNGSKRWSMSKSGIMPTTEPTTEPSTEPTTEPSTEPSTGFQGAPAPACMPAPAPVRPSKNAPARNLNKPKKESLSKESDKKKPPFYPALPGLKGEYCTSLPPEYQSKWDEWELYYRERTRHKMPPTTAAKQIKKLLKYTPAEVDSIIDFSIENGYQGLFPERVNLHQSTVVLHKRKDNTGI